MNTPKKRRITRREYIATEFYADISEVEGYQSRRGEKFPLFCYEGRICAVVKDGDSIPVAYKALEGRNWSRRRSYLNPEVLVFTEIEDGDSRDPVDVAMALCDRKLA